MMRPSSLIRAENDNMPEIVANTNNIPKDSLDCGITNIGWCTSLTCQKLGTTKSFLWVLSLIGIIQGALEMFFIYSVKQTARQFSFDEEVVDWLLVLNGIAQGVLAIVVAYWGNRIHRISWLAGITMFQALLAFLTIIPTLVNHSLESDYLSSPSVGLMCNQRINENLKNEDAHAITTLVLLFIFQIGNALGHIAFIALGISYLDDNIEEHESPGLIAVAIAAKVWGVQWGAGLSLGIGYSPFGWWLGTLILAVILFILGIFVSLFPRRLLSSIVKDAANEIIEVATSNSQISLTPTKFLADIGLWPTLKRLLTNKILVLNTVAAVFLSTAIYNFFFHESKYLESRFYFPASETKEWTSRIISNLLKPPVTGLAIIVSGFIIAKANPRPRILALWNIIIGILAVKFFIGSIFMQCNNGSIAGAFRGKLTSPYCSSNCLCPENIPFSPVCPQNSALTYYSPCHAGCSSEITFNNLRVFSNCSCGVDTETRQVNLMATEGGCNYTECQKYWITFQVLTIFVTAIVGSGLIGNLLISIRSALNQDKALALAFELCLVGLVVYIPGKIGYAALADSACQLWSPNSDKCYLHQSPWFGNLINIVTASLIAAGVFFDVIVFFLIKDLEIYGNPPDEVYRPIPMENIIDTEYENNNNGNTYDTVLPYATTPINSIPNTLENEENRSSTPTPDTLNNSNKLNALVYSELQKNYPEENMPLNFNLQTTDSEFSGPTDSNRERNLPGPSGLANRNKKLINDSDTDSGITYAEIIQPSKIKEYVKRQSMNNEPKNRAPLSPETNF